MSRLVNALKMHAGAMDAGAPVARERGQSVDTASMTAKVMLQPEGVLTDWLPIVSQMVGDGWGLVHAPAAGTQVLCVPDAGDHESYVIVGATWSTASAPPATAQGETWLVHSTGSKVALTNDGKVTVADASGTSLVFGNNGTVTLTGTLKVTGDIIDNSGTNARSMAGMRAVYNPHTHPDPQGGNTGTPSGTM